MNTAHHLALPPGHAVGQYRIERILGYGGFGIVYQAVHADLGQTVAIKEFLPQEIATRDGATVRPLSEREAVTYADMRERFLAEAKQLAGFRHPNIVGCHDYLEANGTAYLVMDYEDGLPLSELLRRRQEQNNPLTEAEIKRLVLPLLDGLATVHAHGILHRDIKPSNIFVRRRTEAPVLIDFGSAKQGFADRTKSAAPYTEGYAAMEQIEGSGALGPWTDIYAVGAVMWRIIANENPPKAENRAFAALRGQPDPLLPAVAASTGAYSKSFLAAIDRCLDMRESRRHQTAKELRTALHNNIPGLPPAPHSSAWVREWDAVAAAIRVALGQTWVQMKHATQERLPIIRRRAVELWHNHVVRYAGRAGQQWVRLIATAAAWRRVVSARDTRVPLDEYWLGMAVVLPLLALYIYTSYQWVATSIWPLLAFIVWGTGMLLVPWVILKLTAARLRDVNRSPWYLLLPLAYIPGLVSASAGGSAGLAGLASIVLSICKTSGGTRDRVMFFLLAVGSIAAAMLTFVHAGLDGEQVTLGRLMEIAQPLIDISRTMGLHISSITMGHVVWRAISYAPELSMAICLFTSSLIGFWLCRAGAAGNNRYGPPSDSSPSPASRSRLRRYIKQHWRGEHSLARAFWTNFILGGLVEQALAWMMMSLVLLGAKSDSSVAQSISLALYYPVFSAMLPLYVWRLVGAWRSAINRSPVGFWGYAVILVAGLSVLVTFGQMQMLVDDAL